MAGETKVTEVIECKLLGVRKPPQVPSKPLYDGKLNDVQWIKISGSQYTIDELDLVRWLRLYPGFNSSQSHVTKFKN